MWYSIVFSGTTSLQNEQPKKARSTITERTEIFCRVDDVGKVFEKD